MVILKNKKLEVVLGAKGAEILKINSQHDAMNYMWKRDASQWASSAPVLFPIVGALQNNECRIDGETYTMTQHGFARHSIFNVKQQTATTVVFELVPDDLIRNQYPYSFVLSVTYHLDGDILTCQYNVENTDTRQIYFQIGGHPAFACPFDEDESSNDYYLEFEHNERAVQKILDVSRKGMSNQEKLFLDNEKRFFIRQDLFCCDAIVLKNIKSTYVTLKSLNHQRYLRFHMENFNHLGIWAAKHVGSLIALEPWNGHSDYVDFKGEFKDKEGMISLAPNHHFSCAFKIEIHQ